MVNRLGPKFHALERVLDGRRAELTDHASGASPEQILVFETTSAGVNLFIEALRGSDLDWLAGYDRDDVAPDADYYDTGHPERLLTTRLFMVMANVAAVDQLLTLWKKWRRRQGLGRHAIWTKVFTYLRDVRYWDARDRVADTRLLEEWHERSNSPWTEYVPIEVELWFRSVDTRSAAEARVRTHVEAAGGEVVDAVVIEGIAYHALLAEIPIAAVKDILHEQSVALVRSDDVHLLRPMPQQPIRRDQYVDLDDIERSSTAPRPTTVPPTVALLDGLPLQRHNLLDGRLIVHDPDGWEASYPSTSRRHGTAMASLILHGDLSQTNDPVSRSLYVRPVLQPVEFGRRNEESPRNRLWLDVIYCAVLELVGATSPSTARDVRIVNLSVGDLYRPFLREISPLARLIDWLAWKHRLLFIVSAGNHGEIVLADSDASIEHRTLQAMQAARRHRRLLSPSESINALTVGAQPVDSAGGWEARNVDEVELVTTAALPSPISALGRGFRGSVKPELLAPGGRPIFMRAVDTPHYMLSHDRTRVGPGQLVAAPGRSGDLTAQEYTLGTSNATALVSRAAMQVLDVVEELRRSNVNLISVPAALLVKSLLVHTSTWDPEAFTVLRDALQTEENRRTFRDYATAFLGYGTLRAERALACELHRATLIGGGELELETAAEHRIPLPASLNAYTALRRVTVTLAWFSPVKPSHRKYRVAALEAIVSGHEGLAVERCDAHANAGKRGTIQHCIFQGERSAARAGDDDHLVVSVRAASDAPGEEGMLIPYALAVTVEVDAGTPIPIYDEIAARIRPRVRANRHGP